MNSGKSPKNLQHKTESHEKSSRQSDRDGESNGTPKNIINTNIISIKRNEKLIAGGVFSIENGNSSQIFISKKIGNICIEPYAYEALSYNLNRRDLSASQLSNKDQISATVAKNKLNNSTNTNCKPKYDINENDTSTKRELTGKQFEKDKCIIVNDTYNENSHITNIIAVIKTESDCKDKPHNQSDNTVAFQNDESKPDLTKETNNIALEEDHDNTVLNGLKTPTGITNDEPHTPPVDGDKSSLNFEKKKIDGYVFGCN